MWSERTVGDAGQTREAATLSIPQQELPPRLRPILDALLGGEAPKRIAFQRGLSLHTVYQYVKQIYRHFDVNSRAELLALFVTRSARGGRELDGEGREED